MSGLPWSTVVTFKAGTQQAKYVDLPVENGLKSAWSHWGKGDQLGTVNRLTNAVVKAGAQEVKIGLSVSLNLPIQFPAKPSFYRREPVVTLKAKYGANIPIRDEEIHMNDQSGTQWDGLLHFGCMAGNCFYQGIPGTEVEAGELDCSDPLKIDPKSLQLGIHHWAAHGITGRGVFLDMVSYYTRNGAPLHYDPCSTHVVSLVDLKACAEYQGVTFIPGDILIIRMGWMIRYYGSTATEKEAWGIGGQEKYAGVENTEEMKAWIWDTEFSAVASDMPSFESWPAAPGQPHLHQTVIANFGCPIGEFFDCELLSEICKEKKRYTFFFVSNPLNILRGCASTANASAIF